VLVELLLGTVLLVTATAGKRTSNGHYADVFTLIASGYRRMIGAWRRSLFLE
jgi:hypothetical protein